MSPGNFNGHNYSGSHTGSGKKQHKGIYHTNKHNRVQPNRLFVNGTVVYNIKTGMRGVIITKDKFTSKRGISKVKYSDDQTQYIRNQLLRTEDYYQIQSKSSKTTQHKSKRIIDWVLVEQKRDDKKQFRERKKQINEKLKEKLHESDYLSQDGSSLNLAKWIANKQDFYQFIVKSNKQTIDDIYHNNKLIKNFIIETLTENYIKRIVEKGDLPENIEKRINALESKRVKYKQELNKISFQNLKKQCDFKIPDFQKSIGEEYEIL